MLIDNIAPAGMKASYFSAQSLGWLGAAVNPLASGVILTTLPAWSLFVVLIIAIVFAWALMLKRNADYPYAAGYHLLIICSQ
ncbi:MFS-type transporter YdeE [Salmonella enterica subsp. enterica]|uniref:MFS-type transporter YdeE n=1 Tax=Salmonella enterica I TaxID=59201 RepID=A0A447U3H4_SALET|nr:MFS-type transporter YdeE [Salmonella enterica subsp. enterica]